MFLHNALVFLKKVRAHLSSTGREVSRVPTPFQVSASPMTYTARSGRQFVVVATGAGPDAALLGLALRSQ